MGKGPYAMCQTWAVVSSNKTVDSTYGRRRDASWKASRPASHTTRLVAVSPSMRVSESAPDSLNTEVPWTVSVPVVEWWQDRYLEVEDERDRWKTEALAARRLLEMYDLLPLVPSSDWKLEQYYADTKSYAAARAANEKENIDAK